VIASWESDVHPEFVREPAEIVRVERSPTIDRPVTPPPSPAPAVSAAYDVAAGLTLGRTDTFAAGASVGAALFPRGAGLGIRLLGSGETEHTIAVGVHEARWRRWIAALELAHRWARGVVAVDAHAGLSLGWLVTEGVDYAQNRSDSAVSFGGAAGIRMAWWISPHAAVWSDVTGSYFPRRDSIYGNGAAAAMDQTPAPRWGAIASVGVAVGRAPRHR
jgi:hypothetical protein